MIEEDKLHVLYNNCYGGWTLSDKTVEMYNLRKQQIDSNFIPVTSLFQHNFECECERHDPILVQIYRELGKDFDGSHSKTKIKTIPKKYKYYYTISEYDGLETIMIDSVKYELDETISKIMMILKCGMTNDEKINELNKFLFDKE